MMVSGASAVVVGDNQKGPLVTMYSNRGDTSDITIPSVFITQNNYRELRYLGIELGQGFLIRMSSDEEETPVLDAIVILIVSPLVVFPLLFFLWRMQLRQLRLADLAPPEVVSHLPIKVFFKSKLKENDPVECVICLDEYVDEDELRVLPLPNLQTGYLYDGINDCDTCRDTDRVDSTLGLLTRQDGERL
ncbi:hypothetical protein BGX23_010466 [Mortierella sp. AD031]|nr:hypothetical protein BGX23_010466 [Mortierella sp. AD031]